MKTNLFKRHRFPTQIILLAVRWHCRYPRATIVTDKTVTYSGILEAMEDHSYFNQPVQHICQKRCSNRIESDHASLKRIINPGKGFESLRSAKSTLLAIEAFRKIKRGHVFLPLENPAAEIRLVNNALGISG